MSTESHRSNEPQGDLLDALVSAERASMNPSEDAQAHTWERVVGTVAMGAPPPVEPTSVATPATAAPWLKVVLGVLLGGAVAAIGYSVTADSEPAADPAPVSSTRSEDPPPRPPPRVAPAAPAAPTAEAAPEASTGEPPAAAAPPLPPRKARAGAGRTSDPPASDLAEETRLLARARARLRAGSPKDALAALSEHASRFPEGQLTEDRMVLRAQALCESGEKAAGRTAAASLRKAFPGSSHLPRVDRACR